MDVNKLFFWSILILFLGCSSSEKIQIDGQLYDAYRPPGTVKISQNLYADETELTNINYKEYLSWTKRIYGKSSKTYQEILPDTSVWIEQNFAAPFIELYFRHLVFDDYPVVGLSLEQAKKYTKWRTDRVAEMILMRKGCVTIPTGWTAETHFTIERYLEGDYDWIIKKEDFLLAKYKIPTIKEWENIAKGNSKNSFGIDSLSKEIKIALKKNSFLFNSKEFFDAQKVADKAPNEFIQYTNVRMGFAKNVNGLYGIIGNVAELVEEEGFAKGGSYHQKLEACKIENNIPIDKPNSWTGFRNICSLELAKVKR